MAITVVEAPADVLSVDESRFPDQDRSNIFEHLLRYCQKFEPLPAITARIEATRAVVVRGHKYFAIAKQLGRPAVRVVVDPASTPEDIARFVALQGVRLLNWEEIRESEERHPEAVGWHVLYFEHALPAHDKRAFTELVVATFGRDAIAAEPFYDDEGPLVEFNARTPTNDHAWGRRLLGELIRFSREHAKIVSYQGAKFGF